jgi:hypothetical protein
MTRKQHGLVDGQIKCIRECNALGISYRALALSFGVSHTTIRRIVMSGPKRKRRK